MPYLLFIAVFRRSPLALLGCSRYAVSVPCRAFLPSVGLVSAPLGGSCCLRCLCPVWRWFGRCRLLRALYAVWLVFWRCSPSSFCGCLACRPLRGCCGVSGCPDAVRGVLLPSPLWASSVCRAAVVLSEIFGGDVVAHILRSCPSCCHIESIAKFSLVVVACLRHDVEKKNGRLFCVIDSLFCLFL